MPTNYTHCAMLSWNNLSELVTFTQKWGIITEHINFVSDTVDLLGHMVFQHKLETEPTNGKQQIFSTQQGHIVFQRKSGKEPTSGEQQVLSTPQGHILFQSMLGMEPTIGKWQTLSPT